MNEIAVFGGTFDPPTRAHEAIIEACLADKRFDQVWLMPSGDRVDKPFMQPALARLAMLEVLKDSRFADEGRLMVSRFELDLPQPTRTCRTVEELNRQYPDDDFWFVYGADSYYDMPNWHQGEILQRKLGMLLIPRMGYELPKDTNNIRSLDLSLESLQDVSSTQVRKAIQRAESVEHLVSPAVSSFILEKGLYQAVQ